MFIIEYKKFYYSFIAKIKRKITFLYIVVEVHLCHTVYSTVHESFLYAKKVLPLWKLQSTIKTVVSLSIYGFKINLDFKKLLNK